MDKKNIKYYILFFVILSSVILFTSCKEKSYKIAVGFKGGTYEKFAESIKNLEIFPLEILNSGGSPDIIRLVNQEKVNLGIAQMDILLNSFQEKQAGAKNIKFVIPLYSEEIHILAKKEIKGISDLTNKKINIGLKNSGTASTAQILFKTMDMEKAIKISNYDTKTAIKKLKENKIDGLFIVAGAPVGILLNIPKSFHKNYHLVSLNDKKFQQNSKILFHYKKASIPAKTYSWQENEVKTLSVVSAIKKKKKEKDILITKLINSIFANKIMLVKYHPKWNDLDKYTMRWYLAGRTRNFHPAAVKSLAPFVKD